MMYEKEHYIAHPANTIKVLQTYNFQFKKQLGQNFLIDLHVLEKIARAAEISDQDIVLEIGPGIGSLTQVMAELAGRVTAVEIDDRLIGILEENLKDYDNVTIIHSDFMKLDLPAFFKEQGFDRPVKVVANLPYYITTPIIMSLFESHIPLASVTVMVQEEVARRMQAKPGTKDYGALSLAVQYYAKPYIAAHVPPNCFMPRPTVGSSVIRLTRCETPPVEVRDEQLMFQLIRAAFGQRRKTLVNAVSGSTEFARSEVVSDQVGDDATSVPTSVKRQLTKETLLSALQAEGLDERVRGEALTLAQFAALSNRLCE